MRTSFFLSSFVFASNLLLAQANLLQSGPMLGYSEMREVMLWVQTKVPARVQFEYWPEAEPQATKMTAIVNTQAETAFTAHIKAEFLEPGKRYQYRLYLNKKKVELPYPTVFQTQTLWQWRTDPPPFTLALGSCTYINEDPYDRPGTPYGADYFIFQSIQQKKPDMMLWLGDNTYLREVDWNSRSGILHRHTHSRAVPEMQALLASTHHYAIWDDHDFGPDDSDRSFIHKDLTLEAFKLFWGNPSYGVNGKPGTTTSVQFNDMDFFLLDNRYYRSPNHRDTGERTILGQEQKEWLIDALAASKAPFKFVAIGGQFLNTIKVAENCINYEEEHQWILDRIEEENIKNVFFLTGDRHLSELARYVNKKGNVLYDLTISPLSSGPNTRPDQGNLNRVEGTVVTQRNFGLLSFSGLRTQRKMKIQIFDNKGVELWNREIESQQ
jgi:alkaline phosphatase D